MRDGRQAADGKSLTREKKSVATGTKKSAGRRRKKEEPKADCSSVESATRAKRDAAKKKRLLNKLKKRPKSAVLDEMPEILLEMVGKAKTGSVPHVKLLMDFADTPDAPKPEDVATLSELLLARLDGSKTVGSK